MPHVCREHLWQWFTERQSDYDVHMYGISRTLHHGNTSFQRVEIYETPQFGKLLVLDGDPQSLQFDEALYHEILVHPAMLTHNNPKRILVLGGGEGATLREVLKHNCVKEVVMVDLDEELVALCRRYLPEWAERSFEDNRVKILYQDAFEYLRKNSSLFDVIISDLTEPLPDSPAHKLYNEEFFGLLSSNIGQNGIFVMQASRITTGRNLLHLDHFSHLVKVFSKVQSFHVFIPSFFSDWGFLSGSFTSNPALLSHEEVDRLLTSRISGSLRFYDGEVHKGLFSLPKELRQSISKIAGETTVVM